MTTVAVPVVAGLWDATIAQLQNQLDFLSELSASQRMEFINQNSGFRRLGNKVVESWNVYVNTRARDDVRFLQDEKVYRTALESFVSTNLVSNIGDTYQAELDEELKALVRVRLSGAEIQRPKFTRILAAALMAQLDRADIIEPLMPHELVAPPLAAAMISPVHDITQEEVNDFVYNTMGVGDPAALGQFIQNSSGSAEVRSTGNQAADAVLTYIGLTIV